MPSPKRLAITITGAVSLGSFEAGVMFEVFDAIANHNKAVDDQKLPPEQKIQVDVMTGASAGGMTAAIAAQKLMFEQSALADPYDNSLYNPWVKDVSLAKLLALQSGESPGQSIFSSNLIADIAATYLKARYSSALPPKPDPHPAAGPYLRLALALSNLNGIDYSATSQSGIPFIYTQFEDKLSVLVDSTSDQTAFWDPVRAAALACGAFPFAFRIRSIWRNRYEYFSPGLANDPALLKFTSDPKMMTYTDGGMLNNQPLGMAKNLVDLIDDHQNSDSRFYLFVSPHAKTSSVSDALTESNSTFYTLLKRIIDVIYGQAAFQDWATAEEYNEQIKRLDASATGLVGLITSRQLTAATLQPVSATLLGALFVNNAAERADDLTRLRQQYSQECGQLHTFDASGASEDEFLNALLVLEKSADLGAFDVMNVFGVTAQDTELASSAATAFMGFFDQKYRDHDYDVGRQKAQAVLKDSTKLAGLGPLENYKPQKIRDIDPKLANLTLKDADQNEVNSVIDRLEDDIKMILTDAGVSGWEQTLAGPIIIRPVLKRVLGI
jgi:predicted acylesterase/phospholipase RssA